MSKDRLFEIEIGPFSSVFQFNDEPPFEWPRCVVPGCPHFRALKRSDLYCSPHTDAHESGATIVDMIAREPRGKR